MLFVVAGYFRPGAVDRREALQESFNEHLMQRVARVRFGGPLFDEAGERTGVMLLVEAADFAAAKAFLLSSPYQEAGLYERIEVGEIRAELGGFN